MRIKFNSLHWVFVPKDAISEREIIGTCSVKYLGAAKTTGGYFNSVARYLLDSLQKLTLNKLSNSYLLLITIADHSYSHDIFENECTSLGKIPMASWMKLFKIHVGLLDKERITFSYEDVTDTTIVVPGLLPTSFCSPSDLYRYAHNQIPEHVNNMIKNNPKLNFQEVMFDFCNDITLSDLDFATQDVLEG